MDAIYEPISLGYSCEVKYQLSRTLYRRKFPNGSDEELRRMLMTLEYGQKNFERHIFDWQITPFPALIEYLERDFQGVFERDDLTVNSEGVVVHRHLATRHPHDFRPHGAVTETLIDTGYAAARSKFDHLAGKFLTHLHKPGPFLYVFRQIRIYDEAVHLANLLRRKNPDHTFKLLFISYPGETDQVLSALEGEVFKGWAPLEADKPSDRVWEGDDNAWDAILKDWTLTVHGGDRITCTFNESLEAPAAPITPAVPPHKSWLSRLMSR